ncbi:ATP-dependent Lon protease [Thermostichus sp. MS-CIW-21]|jgi:ATP-dependent Lon protease|uniref:LON peptidase substrate-binding domain-containing protein n=3 Tax=Synechococcus TaxID=1129 RepID=UPI00006945BC|nr:MULTISPECIES: LON peptidase substrate-binding domain-containing protein [unclassified Synechococcus]ABD00053.1 ATP-dependent protease La domain protein [Synechococcus sp. JA-3-3Ab]PIK87042.1 ATP-dependent protease [Synechococcus sp. 63AY4M2]PIK87961.1 ATP-dependent protease [Synechococcus sp. 65AY6A5]PIK92402.1 ATP-dependent protease [Synechococcus sp. 65AY6Li]PIK96111.1 ATP-dependent protease [Synechococcus sp. 60AY4M2]
MPSSSVDVRELPLFPLPEVVLFPGRPLPLHIFEYRYRMMINTILETDRRFGVLMFDPQTGSPVRVGCCAEVLQVQRLPDDRMDILTLGQQRFRVLNYVREKPFRVGLVEWIEDEPTTADLQGLVQQVSTLLQDVVRLSGKLMERETELPERLPTTPIELSYWVASHFHGAPREQQALLEMVSTENRLRREAEILESTRKHLAARTALKDLFSEIS